MLDLVPRYRPLSLLLALLLLCALPVPALAVEYAEDPFIVTTPTTEEEEKQTDVRVGSLQDRLAELGYYDGNKTFIYDAQTQYAVFNFCSDNGLDYSTRGIRQSVWVMIMSADAGHARGSAEYEDLAFGSSGKAVLEMQTKLKALNYYDGGLVLAPEKFDADTQLAVQRFCEANNISYEGSGAPAAVQQLIFSDGAVEYVLPAEDLTMSEKLSEYMMRDVDISAATLPMFVVWIIGALLVILIAAVTLHFFVREKKEDATGMTLPPSSRSGGAHANVGAEISQEGLHGDPAWRTIDFRIEYQGQTRTERLDCSGTLSIGRGAGDLRLDPNDHMASRAHCDLSYEGAVLMLNDHSRNGTLVNGNTIHNCKCRVNSGDKLTIGSHTISIHF